MLQALLLRINPLAGYREIWSIGRQYTWTLPIVVVGSLISNVLEGVGISLLIPLLGTLMPGGEQPTSGALGVLNRIPNLVSEEHRLPFVAFAILGLVVLKGIFGSLNSVFIGWIDGRAAHEVRMRLARRLTEVGYPFYLKNDPAELLTILSSQSWSATEAIRTVYSLVADAAAVVVFTVLLLALDWRLTLIVGVVSAVISLGQNAFKEKIRKFGERSSAANHVLGQRMLVIIEAFRMIKIFGEEAREQKKFNDASEEVRMSLLAAERFAVWLGPAVEAAHASLFIGILLGAYYANVPPAVLIAFLVLLYRGQPFLQSIDGGFLSLAESSRALDEVEWMLDPSDKPVAPSGSLPFDHLSEPVRFENVTFRYETRPKGAPALSEVSFALRPGRVTALIGRSGSGKTTVVNLLCRLLLHTEGRILVNGIDLTDVEVQSWRARLGFAGQDVELVEGTIADNIAYGAPEATREEIVEAARLADVDDFIKELPEGYDTKAGTRGLSLSGGQRQRIGLARALVRRPQILVLDEATNAIDATSEKSILEIVRRLGLTTLVVSHRPSTLSYCDDGVVIERGRITETGPLVGLEAYKRLGALSAA